MAGPVHAHALDALDPNELDSDVFAVGSGVLSRDRTMKSVARKQPDHPLAVAERIHFSAYNQVAALRAAGQMASLGYCSFLVWKQSQSHLLSDQRAVVSKNSRVSAGEANSNARRRRARCGRGDSKAGRRPEWWTWLRRLGR